MAASAAFILSELDQSYDAKKNTSQDLSIDTRNSLLDTSGESTINTSLDDSFFTNITEETDHTFKATNVSRKKKSNYKRRQKGVMHVLESPMLLIANEIRNRIENDSKMMKDKAAMNHKKYLGFSEALRNSFQCGCASSVDDYEYDSS